MLRTTSHSVKRDNREIIAFKSNIVFKNTRLNGVDHNFLVRRRLKVLGLGTWYVLQFKSVDLLGADYLNILEFSKVSMPLIRNSRVSFVCVKQALLDTMSSFGKDMNVIRQLV